MPRPEPYYSEVGTIPTKPSVRQKLVAAGFRKLDELYDLTPVELAGEADVSPEDAQEVLDAIGGRHASGRVLRLASRSGADVLAAERARRDVTTFCPDLDELLGGGVAPGEVTELCGVPGVGKTQLGAQLAISVQLPECLGGLGGECVYVDTEGSFLLERVAEMADAAARHVRNVARAGSDPALSAAAEAFTGEGVLDGIHYVRVHDATEQRAVVESLPDLLSQHPAVRLVVIDSVAFHYRQAVEDMPGRTRLLAQMSQDLTSLAARRGVAVVTTNQVTTKVYGDGSSKLVPALGESFAHACTTRVVLHWDGPERVARLFKSPRLPPGAVSFCVTADGVRARRAAHKRPAAPQQAV